MSKRTAQAAVIVASIAGAAVLGATGSENLAGWLIGLVFVLVVFG